MPNLNKFTKHELINKIKRLDNQISNQNQSTLIKIIEYILHFKSLILKLTLIGFIIRWIKKYSLVHRLWHIFRWIATGILGISLIDIYSLDIISWIKELQIYKWYSQLFFFKEIIKENKTEVIQFPKRITEKTNENETEHIKISEWINRNNQQKIEINKEDSIWDTIQNNSKTIIIISGVIIVSSLSYYYFDEIKDSLGTSIEWIKNYFSRPPSNSSNSNSENIPTHSTENFQSKLDKYFKLPESNEIANSAREIELIDKGKSKVLTSPSLDNLNSKAEEAWNDSNSDSSTITPEKFKDSSSSVIDSSSSSSCTPFASPFITKNWKVLITNNLDDFDFIQNTFSSEKVLTKEAAHKLVESLANIMVLYDDHITSFNRVIEFKTEAQINGYKQTMYHFREWISNYYKMIFPLAENKIEIGSMFDEPNTIC